MWLAHLLKNEEQRLIPGWDGYYVTSRGRVFSYKHQGWQTATVCLDLAPKLLKPTEARVGHTLRSVWTVSLNAGRVGKRQKQIAHLVLEAFVGPRPRGLMACHEDDDTANNTLSNLRYDTREANTRDAIRNGRTQQGERHHSTKLTNAEALNIRTSTDVIAVLAVRYRVSRGVVENIKKYRSYKYVGGVSRITWSGRGRKPRYTKTGG